MNGYLYVDLLDLIHLPMKDHNTHEKAQIWSPFLQIPQFKKCWMYIGKIFNLVNYELT